MKSLVREQNVKHRVSNSKKLRCIYDQVQAKD